MVEEHNNPPSLVTAFLRAFGDSPEARQMADSIGHTVSDIGATIASAGVVMSQSAVSEGQLGQLAVAANLPNKQQNLDQGMSIA